MGPSLRRFLFAALTIATSVCATVLSEPAMLNAALGAAVWFIILLMVEASANTESEIDRANREATHVEETWIRE